MLEGDLVNVNVTAPAATIALALVYLKTNDAHVAGLLSVPTTRHALAYVRPDLLQLRVLARCLVLWDEVAPTEAWLQSQLPPLLQVALMQRARFDNTRQRRPRSSTCWSAPTRSRAPPRWQQTTKRSPKRT